MDPCREIAVANRSTVITGSSKGRHGSMDIWSLGCVVLEMATGHRPWAQLDNEWAIMWNIAAGHPPQPPSPEQLSELGLDFLNKCFERDPRTRPSAAELLQHDWVCHSSCLKHVRRITDTSSHQILAIRSQVIEPSTPSSENSSHSGRS